jgi:membrane protease YdiL (CAAX protease family)
MLNNLEAYSKNLEQYFSFDKTHKNLLYFYYFLLSIILVTSFVKGQFDISALCLALAGAVSQSYLNFKFMGRTALAALIRPFIRISFYIWPVFFVKIKASVNFSGTSIFIFLALLIFLVWYKKKEFFYSTSKEYLILLPPVSQNAKIFSGPLYLGGAIGQEILYRGLLILILLPYLGYYVVLLSAILFTFEHYLQEDGHNSFEKIDFQIYFIFSIAISVLVLMTNSAILPAILHVTYNLPRVFSVLLRPLAPRSGVS